ncbi:GNAT family N-acetyltransferase [Pseudooceanicola sp.]|uniref:GNAT family N-acetyltransferase n=1 Tax=Pseudooceanicola sp. TaxID=1914328 RepID=UPI0026272995|nr:GNAT family N-acetyltransferase [Pseudooceanicola sp.]MDF1856719.1 GNAT family N-acetyltransferase [Pseudooceanicola sp.]
MTSIPVLTTERLTLRGPDASDVAPITTFYASERSHFVGGPKDADGAWRQLGTEIGHWTLRGYGRWMVDLSATGATVGIVGLWNPVGWPEPEIGWDLFDGFEGKGYATEAAAAARAYAYDVLGWSTAISLVAPDNTGSAAVASRLGAVLESSFDHAKLGHLQVWRHPGPDDLENGGMGAYA